MNKNSLNRYKAHHNKWIFNLLLWVLLFFVILFLFADFPLKKIDFIYVVSYLLTLIPPVSLLIYYLVPKFLKKEKYVVFVILSIIIISLFSYLNIQFHQLIIDKIFTDYYFISYYNDVQTLIVFAAVSLIATFFKLLEDWIHYNQNERREIEERLKVLKGQINPHFLFNSLNVLYSLSVGKNKEVTEATLQLSNILRYVLYDSERKTTIEKEKELIENYIAFEKNRHTVNSTIKFISNIDTDSEIQPMLLLPLVENSFKHGLKSNINNPFVIINLEFNKNVLLFEIENNFKANNLKYTEEYNGIGVKNIKENLAILYPNKQELTIEKTNETYKVKLVIDLK
ncbi:sensor histidine kinase [uncultured Tenacibaculum sp.]|uniref:sensor histidine kinase n=1 Tax=uncultured Tenacibaculum sp. TaxID=174713 RepID=UPI002630F65C|nr:sensor histidine kinase [uncultured Tenacibaculum sp.]